MGDSVRVGIIDDDKDYIELLSRLLSFESDMVVAFGVGNRNEALKNVSVFKPDVLLMDIDLKDKEYTGIDITREILKDNPYIKVIMLTSMEEKNSVINSVEAGAVNYLPKSQIGKIPDLLSNSIRQVSKGFCPFGVISGEIVRMEVENKIHKLTNREHEVYELILEGLNKKEIARRLIIEENSVKNNISSILKKLGAKNCKEVISKYKNVRD